MALDSGGSGVLLCSRKCWYICVTDAGGRGSPEEERELVSMHRYGKKGPCWLRRRPLPQRSRPGMALACDDPDHTEHDREQGQGRAVHKNIGLPDQILRNLGTQ